MHAGNAEYFGRQELEDIGIHFVCLSWVVAILGAA